MRYYINYHSSDWVAHSSGPWKNHKYIKKVGDDYIYSEEDQKHLDEKADEVIRGKYKNGEERRKALEKEGESYEAIQNVVNKKLGNKYRYEIKQDGDGSDDKDSKDSKDSKNSKKSGSSGSDKEKSWAERYYQNKWSKSNPDYGKSQAKGSSGSSKSSGSSSASSKTSKSASKSSDLGKNYKRRKNKTKRAKKRGSSREENRTINRQGVMEWLQSIFG